MKDVEIKSLYRSGEAYADSEITVRGWVRTNRGSNKFGFIELNDGSFFKSVQVVYEAEFLDNFEEISKAPIAAALKVTGLFVLTPEAKQPFEIKAREVVIEAGSDSDYPLQKKRHSMEFLREIAHLRPRSNTFSAVFRVRSMVAYAIHKFFQEKGFVYVHTPIITASDCEGAGEMFKVTTLDMGDLPKTSDGSVDYSEDFFGKEAGLTVSGQLEAETFEMAFAELSDDMDVAEDMIKYIINYVMENAPEEMEFFNKFVDKGLLDRLQNIVSSDFERITYTEAVEMLRKSGEKFQYPVEWGIDLQTEHERYITEKIYKKPVFVTDYPKEIKAFYMRLNDDEKTVAACDLLVPGVGEIIGGSQREERYDVLKARIEEMGMTEEDYWWYMDLRKYGGVKHSGYGLGFERIIMYITGMSNIRDVLPFPRTPKSAEF